MVSESPPRYFATLPAGLEGIAALEVTELRAVEITTHPGLVAFSSDAPPTALLGLRSVERLCVWVGEREDVPLGTEGPAQVRAWACRLDWESAAEVRSR